jgi:hypothetical protein
MPEELSLSDETVRKSSVLKQALISLGVGLLVVVVGGMIVYWWQSAAPDLVFSSPETIPYPGENRNVAVYQITIANKGKKLASSISCFVQVPGAHIDDKHLSVDKALKVTETITDEGYRLEVPELNPGESLVVSVLVSGKGTLPVKPEVHLRASGVSGRDETGSSGPVDILRYPVWIAVVLALLGTFSSLASFVLRRNRRPVTSPVTTTASGKHSGDQRYVLAYLCGVSGLISEMDRLLSLGQETQYWAEADRLASVAIASGSGDTMESHKTVLKMLLLYADLASSSEGIVCYSIGRIAARQGHNAEAKEYLTLAKDKMSALFEQRLIVDRSTKDLWLALQS